MKQKHLLCMLCCILAIHPLFAQKSQQQPMNIGAAFLLVNPDARSSAMGDAVTGIEPDANALFGNAAKIPFAGDWGVSASYSPWMWDLNDSKTHMGYVSAFKSWNNREGVGLSVKYFDHGEVTFRDDNGMELQQYRPREYAIDGTYARKLGQHLGMAVSLRYIRSELGSGTYNGLVQKPASAVAGDVGLYYQNYADHIEYGNRYSWGISFTNIGSKLKYTEDNNRKTFLPMNLRIGGGYTFVHTEDHQFSLAVDINKLLVPTPPVYKLDAGGFPTDEIESGRDPDRGIVESIFSSFGDAPGGFGEEIREFTIGSGMEYAYQHKFFARAGYFYEHPNKGNRQHFAAGVGVNISGFRVDMAYLMPTGTSLLQRKSLRFTLMYSPRFGEN
ncbi:type IX secretion system outer membrane channel protein PorV [Chitinophaga sp. XS-30]|uniref:type IX secretion system outer membrane channel protein PorV n=1 Tax=Chitinophaga sp. XS-30 TaxID=2604421 RepID=UPI0011DD9227|nr:type IX secretion system outer membrane channel protein PorV [Chitinophaga sp. XS-30]QEH43512.1 type IX secretion system outer membrane channel protein PorV [Chitinophaga sp. XS-30]